MITHIACFINHLLILVFAYSQCNAVHIFVENITHICSYDLDSYWLNHSKSCCRCNMCVDDAVFMLLLDSENHSSSFEVFH